MTGSPTFLSPRTMRNGRQSQYYFATERFRRRHLRPQRDFDGAAADGTPYRAKFTGKYDHRVFAGIGHNVPQEASQPFARAVVDADRL